MKRIVFAVLLTLTLPVYLNAADLRRLVQETQQMTQKGNMMNIVWWIPTEFWEESLKQDPQVTQQQKEAFRKVLDEYVVFVVANMTVGAFGGITPKSREEVIKNVQLKVGEEVLRVLSPDELTPDAANLFIMMKPMFSNMLGQFGQGMEFLAYSNTKDGQKIVDPLKKGFFVYTSFGDSFRWRLPLGSLLPPMCDRVTGEEFPGNYIYNPFTGEKLIRK